MTRHTLRALAAGALATTAFAAPAVASAATQEERALGLPVPDLGQLITDLGATLGTVVGSTVPGTGAIVTESSGTAGGIVTGTTSGLTTAIDDLIGGILADSPLSQILGPNAGGGGSAGGLLPADALEQLFITLGIPVAGGKAGAPGGGSAVEVDARAPEVTFKLLTTKLRNTGRDGRLKLQVTSDEPGIVALTTAIRPGKAVRRSRTARGRATGGKAPRHSRALIRVPTVTLGFKKAGRLKITVRLSKKARATLARSRDMRISARLIAADTVKNQAATSVKRSLKR